MPRDLKRTRDTIANSSVQAGMENPLGERNPQRLARHIHAVQENVRLLFDRQQRVENEIPDPEIYDDTQIRDDIDRLRRDLSSLSIPSLESVGSSSDLLSSQFYATKANSTEVAVNAGKIVRGTTVTTIAQANVNISPVGTQTFHLYLESWYNLTVKQQYSSSTTYPTQAVINDGGTDFPCERFLIATIDVVSGSINEVYPEQIGEIHSSRIWT